MEKSTVPDPKAQTYCLDKSLFQWHKAKYTGDGMPEGLDYQGIQWKTEMRHTSRKMFQLLRHAAYKPYREFKERSVTVYPLKHIKEGEPYYTFERFYKLQDLWKGHFQLKHNIIAPTNSDVLFPYSTGFNHYSLSGLAEKRFSIETDLNPVSIDYRNNVVALSGYHGNLTIYDMKKEKLLCSKNVSDNGTINNTVAFFKQKGSSDMKLCCGGNDRIIQVFDLEKGIKPISKFAMDSPINYLKPSPDNNLVLALSDQEQVDIVDIRTKDVVIEFHGHEDYGFSGDWHPDGHYVATGNQDSTCRIWDLRKPNREVKILMSQVGNASSVKYSPTGAHLAVGENIDFVEIYNVDKHYEEMQVIDFFGELSGLTFDEEHGENLFIGVMLVKHNGIFEYNLKKSGHLSTLSKMMF